MFSRSLFRKEGLEIWGCSFVSELKLRSTSFAEKNFANEITWITWKTEQNLEILKIWTHFSSFESGKVVEKLIRGRLPAWTNWLKSPHSGFRLGRSYHFRIWFGISSRGNMGKITQFKGWFSNIFLNVKSPTAPIEGSRTSQQTCVRRCVATVRLILCWGDFVQQRFTCKCCWTNSNCFLFNNIFQQ